MEDTKTYRAFGWINRHARLVLVGVLLSVLTLGVVGPIVADTDEPNFDPAGEIFDVANRGIEHTSLRFDDRRLFASSSNHPTAATFSPPRRLA